MPFRKKMRKQTMGKTGVKHAGTLVDNIGSANITKYDIIVTDAGARQETDQVIQGNATTDEVCRTGDLIKFVNLHIQIAGRDVADPETMGWLEYAAVWKREAEADISTTELGTLTLGTVATNLYRNDCIWTGFIPVGLNQPNGVSLALKMPKTKQFLKLGEEFILFLHFRSQFASGTSAISQRLIVSHNYKAYS